MYRPTFKGPIEGWLTNYCAANQWRTRGLAEFDDLLQDGYIVFARCAARYPELDAPEHFMALYKTAWINHFNDLSVKATRIRNESADQLSDGESERVSADSLVGESDNDGYLSVLIAEAPREVKLVLSLFLNAPSELLDAALLGWRGKDRRCRTNGSKVICRLLGLPADLDVLQMVEDHFGHH